MPQTIPPSKIVWTALPNGWDGNQLKVTVVVSPRLTPASISERLLSGYSGFSDWPDRLRDLRLFIEIGGKRFETALPRSAAEPSSDLWRSIFPPEETHVGAFEFKDMSRVNLNSYPTAAINTFLQRHYGQLAEQSGPRRPQLFPYDVSELRDLLDDMGSDRPVRGVPRMPGKVAFDPGADKRGEDRRFVRLLADGPVDKMVREQYFGEDGERPDIITGPDGEPMPNTKGFTKRVLPDRFEELESGLRREFGTAAAYDFYRANRFYSRPENRRPYLRHPDPALAARLVNPPPPKYDFHRMLAALADAPELARRLGLLINLRIVGAEKLIEKMRRSSSGELTGKLRVVVDGISGLDDVRPFTAFQMRKDLFLTLPSRQDQDHADGCLKLETVAMQAHDSELTIERSRFDFLQVDTDGSALKLINTVMSFQKHVTHTSDEVIQQGFKTKKSGVELKQAGGVTYTTTGEESLPALRSAGITVVKPGRAGELADKAMTASVMHDVLNDGDGSDVTLFMENVLRGYRLDVMPGKTDWKSLCQRQVNYAPLMSTDPNEQGPWERIPVEDEGYVKGASTTSKLTDEGEPDPDDHYLHESLFRWEGWSLVAPRPGRRIKPREHGLVQEEVVDEVDPLEDRAEEGVRWSATATAQPGSLPTLRFGTQYRFRARVVDLACNSLPLKDKSLESDQHASEPIVYQRFEPLDPPAVMGTARISEGESLEHVVIRSSADLNAEGYLQTSPYAGNDPEQTGFEYQAINHRHFIPPKTSQALAEHHGMFDWAMLSGSADKIGEVFSQIASREAGTLFDGPSAQLISPPGTPPDDSASLSPAFGTPGFRLKPGEYVIHPDASLPTPYLPDPIAGGVVFRGLPGLPVVSESRVLNDDPNVYIDFLQESEEPYLFVGFGGSWPEVNGFRLQVEERPERVDSTPCDERFADQARPTKRHPRDGLPVWDARNRVLRVFLRKGEIAPVRYSCAVDPHFWHHNHLGLGSWAKGEEGRRRIRLLSEAGSHWMVTPDRLMTLVHATPKPICAPSFETGLGPRLPGQTDYFLCRQKLDFARIRLHARTTQKLEVLAEWKEWIDDPSSERPVRKVMTAQLPEVTIMQPTIRDDEPKRQNLFDLAEAAGQRPNDPDKLSQLSYRQEFGDHKFRLLRYRLRGTSRFREYMPPSIATDETELQFLGPVWNEDRMLLPPLYDEADPDQESDSHSERGAPVLPVSTGGRVEGKVVHASNRPDEPLVAYALPTYRWDAPEQGNRLNCTRLGNGIRVWLDRPWYSSGEGELLGVVLSPGPELPDYLEPYVTRWARDPLFASDAPKTQMRPQDFPAGVINDKVPLAENVHPDQRPVFVDVVGHRVYWDDDRKQWYCDIEFKAGSSYTPMVRLALVRYQPNGCNGCEISTVYRSEFLQLLPNRRVTIQKRRNRLDVRVFGPAPDLGSASGEAEEPGISEFFDICHGNHRGQNRIEVVVQVQKSNFETDLDWIDVKTLGYASASAQTDDEDISNHIELAPFERPIIEFDPTGVPSTAGRRPTPAITRPNLRARPSNRVSATSPASARIRFDRPQGVLEVDELVTTRPPFDLSPAIPITPFVMNRIWSETVGLARRPANMKARLVVREYERYLGDDVETSPSIFGKLERIKTEERLVFAREFYVLGYVPESGNG